MTITLSGRPNPRRWISSYRVQVRLFLVPYLVGTVILVVLPTLAAVAVAFTEYNAIRPPRWVGLENFRTLLESPLVWHSLRNSLIFIFLAVPLRLVGALILGLLLRGGRRSNGILRAAVFLPTIIPETAYALVWLWIFNPVFGPLNMILGWAGLPTPDWLVEPGTARLAMVIMALLQIGEGFIVVLVALQSVPRATYEAATVDGANAWQSFWRITLPLITPWLLLLTFRDLVVSLQNTFTPTFVMTYGGPYYATTFVPLLFYELAFDFFDFGVAGALMILMTLLTAFLVVGIVNLVGLRQHDEAL